jgi:hypothetical protein
MYASVTQTQLLPDKIDEAVRIFEIDVVPAVKPFPGLQHFYLVADVETGKGYTIGGVRIRRGCQRIFQQ